MTSTPSSASSSGSPSAGSSSPSTAGSSAEFPAVHFTGRALLAMPAQQLHPLYKLRVDVFVHEQQTPFAEIDDIDPNPNTHHVLAYIHPGSGPEYPFGQPDPGSPLRLVGTARVYGKPDDQHIGRMCVAKDVRGRGIASQIMEQALEVCKGRAAALDPTTQVARVSLNAQEQVQDFYAKFGFKPCLLYTSPSPRD